MPTDPAKYPEALRIIARVVTDDDGRPSKASTVLGEIAGWCEMIQKLYTPEEIRTRRWQAEDSADRSGERRTDRTDPDLPHLPANPR